MHCQILPLILIWFAATGNCDRVGQYVKEHTNSGDSLDLLKHQQRFLYRIC